MSFSGFSEDDIKKLKSDAHKVIIKENEVTFKSDNNITSTKSKNISIKNNVNGTIKHILDEAKLDVQPSSQLISVEPKPEILVETELSFGESTLDDQKLKYQPLEEFEIRQKIVEEQNRKRKELLAKALADRTKQTQEEAIRLNQIQEEFKMLDAMLSNDVKILRKQIEIASFDYAETEKRYRKIEKDFLHAKILLHQKLEKKELLTEHLCAIIEKNEERKAEKLNELLEKLQVKLEVAGISESKETLN